MTAQIGARLEDSLKLVEETIECIRDVMAELRPAVLDDYGLTPVLRWYAEQYVKRTGVATTVIEQGSTRRLPRLRKRRSSVSRRRHSRTSPNMREPRMPS